MKQDLSCGAGRHTEGVPRAHPSQPLPLLKEHPMSRLPLVDANTTPAESRSPLEQIARAFRATPNMFKTVAHSPPALKSMWGSFGALSKGGLDARLGEQIAVAVADRNGCEYCLAAHTALGRKAGATAGGMAAAQAGEASDPQASAALRFALKLVNERGHVGAEDLQALRAAGFNDAQIVEVVAHVALNLFTNYVNVAFAVPLDFP